MTYFIALSLLDIDAINSRGLELNRDTTRWGNVIKHPLLPQWATGIEDHDVNCFLDKQLPSILIPVTAQQMLTDGWNL